MKKYTLLLTGLLAFFSGCSTNELPLTKKGEHLILDKNDALILEPTALHKSRHFFAKQARDGSHLYIDMINSSHLNSQVFYNNEQTILKTKCATLSSHIYETEENTQTWQQSCQNNISSKQDFVIFKTLKTADTFYVIKRHWVDAQPSKETIENWLEYLERIEIQTN